METAAAGGMDGAPGTADVAGAAERWVDRSAELDCAKRRSRRLSMRCDLSRMGVFRESIGTGRPGVERTAFEPRYCGFTPAGCAMSSGWLESLVTM